MPSITKLSLRIFGLAVCSLVGAQAAAFDCHSYDEVTAKLTDTYKEQVVFSGFTDSDTRPDANAIYELWVNPDGGNWSLLAQRVFLFQRDAKAGVVGKSCVQIVNSGKRHRMLRSQPVVDLATSPGSSSELTGSGPATVPGPGAAPDLAETAIAAQTPPSADDSVMDGPVEPVGPVAVENGAGSLATNLNCIPRERHAAALKERYNEVPIMRALADDDTVLEIYGSNESWTITLAKIREVRNTMTGRPLTEELTGQKIHQLCSDPAYSGKTWTVFEPVRAAI